MILSLPLFWTLMCCVDLFLFHVLALFAAKKIPVKYLNCADSTLLKEIDILKMISHANIISLLDYAASS